MDEIATTLDELPRPTLVAVAHEHMLSGLLFNRALLPQVMLHTGSRDPLNDVAIDLWMGASPVYTRRTRELMSITGDDVEAIIRTLQLDVGFAHQYMEVGYEIRDGAYAEFWLNHCGALIDAEPHGEEQVFGMCHTIEDPTFDATALATNPRARIRSIHRPPRTPADRSPHCHWTIVIDPNNEPIGPVDITEQVRELALATVPNARGSAPAGDGVVDATEPFDPQARLGDLSSATLAAMAREFQVQTHLLAAAAHIALEERFGADIAREMMKLAWTGTAALVSERMAPLVETDTPAERIARVLALHPAVPPGWSRQVHVDHDRVRLELAAEAPGLGDRAHPGFVGLCAAGEPGGLEAMVTGVDPTAAVEVSMTPNGNVVVMATPGAREPDAESDTVAMMRVGVLTTWEFDHTPTSVDMPSRRSDPGS